MDQNALRDAVYGGANAARAQLVGGPSNEHPGNEGDAVINAAFAHQYSAPIAAAQANAAVNQSQINVEEAKKAAAIAEQQKQDMLDPKKYQMVPKADGGFAFFDPAGNPITAHDYARAVGASVDQVLAKSENPIDIGFRNDYKNLRDYLTAWQNGDQKKIKAIQDQAPELKKYNNPQDLIRRFYQAYPTVFGGGGFNGPGTAGQYFGSSFIPSAGGSTDSGYGIDSSSGIGG